MKAPIRRIISAEEVKQLLERIYPNGEPSDDWRVVGLDSEFKKHENGTYTIYYMQISNGRENICIDGPGTSRARGKVQDLLVSFRGWLHDKRVRKAISTVSAEYRALRQYIEIQGVLIDTEVADWLLDENRREHGLKSCATDHLELHMKGYKDVFGFVPPGKKKTYVPNMEEIVWGSDKFDYVPWTGEQGREKAEKYASLDPYATKLLSDKQIEELKRVGLWDWYREVERPFTLTLIRAEDRGIKIDLPVLLTTKRKVQDALLRKRHLFRALVDKPDINLRSNDQLGVLFFAELGWPIVKYTKRSKTYPKGRASLDKEALGIYAEDDYELAKLLQGYRLDSTQNSTFLEGMYVKLDENWLLHTIFHQARVVTGRLSSGRAKEGLMNLQNIPAQKDRDPYQIRKLFIPTKPGYRIICGDYSQIELYILAQMSLDPVMVEAFKNGEDLHILTACKIWGFKYPGSDKDKIEAFKEEHKTERGKAKTVNFGLCIAGGQRVLTHVGLVPIEQVQDWHMVWDGVEWVHHDGVVCTGEKRVMTYDGLTATPEHEVYTTDGSRIPFRKAASAFCPRRLAIGAIAEVPVRYSVFDRKSREEGAQPQVCRSFMPCLRSGALASRGQCEGQENHQLHMPSKVWGRPPRLDPRSALRRYGAAVLSRYACFLEQLQRSWDQGAVQIEGTVCSLGAGEVADFGLQGFGFGPQGQQRALLENQHTSSNKVGELEEPTTVKVYDIINAGPCHRFTVEGKVVSNCYGMGAYTLAKRIKVDVKEAEKYIEDYFDLYKGVRAWSNRQIAHARKHGYVRTMGGYYRRLGEWINSSEQNMRDHAERQAMNAPIQGTAAQIIKVAMNAVEFGSKYTTRWMEPVPEIDDFSSWGVEQLLQVHDEIVLQCPEEYADQATLLVEKVMVASFKKQFTDVSIKANVAHGASWFDAKA